MRYYPLLAVILLCLCSCAGDDVYYEMNAPFTAVAIPADTLSINPAIEQKVTIPGGATISIPANAFTDADGNVVTKPVKLAFTNYNTPASILASGIPMKYSEGGKQYDFESAGMFAIEGYADGKKINVANGKTLGVSYPSAAKGEYDFFVLEEKAGTTLLTAGPGAANTAPAVKTAKWRKLTNIARAEEYHPEKSKKDFILKFNTAKYPQLASLAGINWHLATEFADPTAPENKWALDTAWEYLEISQPKYIAGKVLYKHKERPGEHTQYYVAQDRKHALMANDSTVTLWNAETNNTITLPGELQTPPGHYYSLHYFSLLNKNACHLYDMNGKLIVSFDGARALKIFEAQKRVLYLREKSSTQEAAIVLADYQNHILREVTTKNLSPFLHFGWYTGSGILTSNSDYIISREEEMSVYDWDGELIAKNEMTDAGIDRLDKDRVYIGDGYRIIWNYRNNTRLSLPLTREDYVEIPVEGSEYILTGRHDKNSSLFFYKENMTIKLDFTTRYNHCPPDQSAGIMWGVSKDSIAHFYSTRSKKEVVSFKIPPSEYDRENLLSFAASETEDRMLIYGDSIAFLYNLNGKKIADISGNKVEFAFFAEDGNIVSCSRFGSLKSWNKNGVPIFSRQLKDRSCATLADIKNEKVLVFRDATNKTTKIYNIDGQLLEHPLTHSFPDFLDSCNFTVRVNFAHQEIVDKKIRPQYIYQLNLHSPEASYQTYVYLDPVSKQILDKYLPGLQEAYIINARREREQRDSVRNQQQNNEAVITRMFEIAQFGIYNYDRIIDAESRLLLTAAFNVPGTAADEMTIFLVTKMGGNAVVKYPNGSWSKFTIDTTAPNKLLAVLPGNEIAICTEEELKRINWGEVAKTKAHTFTLARTGKKITSIKDLEALL